MGLLLKKINPFNVLHVGWDEPIMFEPLSVQKTFLASFERVVD